jgi:hypothetical protein
MSSDLPWTQEIGNAFLAQRADVMDAVQRMRQEAKSFGYLQSNANVIVNSDPYVEILPVNPDFIFIPYYDPLIVFAAPLPGFAVTTAIRFRYGVPLGAAFAPWGWRESRFAWGEHAVIINRVPWQRTWSNRATYVHPYAVPHYAAPRPPEQHRLIERSPRERENQRFGRQSHEEHRH